jgi:cytochrome c oxidase subunit 2
VPGHTNFTWFKIPKPGVFRGQCAELCGRNHADMVAEVVAVEPAQFKQWLARKKAEIEAANKAAEVRRKQEAEQTAAGASPANGNTPPTQGGES